VVTSTIEPKDPVVNLSGLSAPLPRVEYLPHQVAVRAGRRHGIPEQRRPRRVPAQQPPVGRVRGHREVVQPGGKPLDPAWHLPFDTTDERGEVGCAVQDRFLLGGQAQRGRELR